MPRAERLFRIVAILHREKMATGEALAEIFSVSLRTIYRDIRTLNEAGIPIRGEAGVGYRFGPSKNIFPL